MKLAALGGAIVGGSIIASLLALKSGKFDKQLNLIFSVKEKIKDLINEKFQLNLKNKIKNVLNFNKAKAHFVDSGKINGNNQVSGAHEVREFIKTLINKNGNIISIKPSKTDNGIWEILYEIDGKISDTPKSVYKSKELSDIDLKNLKSLIRKHKNTDLVRSVSHFENDKIIISADNMEKQMQEALESGFIIKTPDMENETIKAKRNADKLYSKIWKNQNKLAKAKSIHDKLLLEKEAMIKNPDIDKKGNEFQQKIAELKQARNKLENLQNENNKLKSKYNNAKKHYYHTKNSVNIFGERDGKLFGAFAHYENNKIIVDSYFPITHGSKLQQAFVQYCLNKKLLTLSNIKCLISAKTANINDYISQLKDGFKASVKSGKPIERGIISTTTYSMIKADYKLIKLDKQREKELNKTA